MVQGKKRKIDFQDGGHSGHIGFLIRRILAILDLLVTPMLPTEFEDRLSVQQKKRKINFQDSHHGSRLGSRIGTILPFYNLQVILVLPTKFRNNWPFGSGEEEKIDFQDGGHSGHI